MSDLPPGMKDFGERLERAAEREIAQRGSAPREGAKAPRRQRSRLRSFGIPALAALAAAAVSAGAASVVTRSGDPIAPKPLAGGAVHRDPSVVEKSAAANPAGGPPWVLRIYTDARGRECIGLGRLQDHVFGEIQGGRFRPVPRSAQGACAATVGARPLIAVERRSAIGLTIVLGLADDPAPVTVRVGDRERTVTPAALGAFVTVFSAADPEEPVAVRSTVDGRVEVRRLRG
jgi:hypothetical protein